MIRRHAARGRSSRFVVWWALLLSQLLFSCASAAPEDGAPDGERLGKITQAICTSGGVNCGGSGDACCPGDGDTCCGTTCIKAISALFCCGSNVCNDGDFCADGQCCNTACNGKCQACSAAKTGGTNGICASIPDGSDPDNECAYNGSNCAVGDTCNGGGACRAATPGSVCGATTCSGSTLTGSQCSGNNCSNSSTSCGNYLCADGSSCGTSCTGDGNCITSAYCRNDHTCQPDLNDGLACSSNTQCKNGHCVDGVCCETACTATCQACSAAKKGSGADGVCDDVKDGTDPDNNCSADASTSCQKDGFCDGQGACRLYDSKTSCGAGNTCSGSTLTGHHCDGSGNCLDGQTSCLPYLCANAACPNECGGDNACATGNYCLNKKCVPKLDDGTACSAGRECSSGFCVEKVCCDSACDGTCQACTAANKASGDDGACGDAKAGTDAHDDCIAEDPLTCQHDGSCDGAGACRLYLEGFACGDTNCENNVQTGHACDGKGTCLDNSEHACALYVCRGDACTTACTVHADCSDAAYCNVKDGICEEKLPDGTACDDAAKCTSNLCVDGLCCNKACAGQCEACDVVTAPGTCSPIVGEPHGIRPKCDPGTEDDVCSARACDGEQDNTSCVGYVGSEVTCREESCSEGVETFSATCDKAGSCGAVKTKKCEPYVCQGSGCGSAPCESDQDCAPKFRCDASKKDCVPKDVASCDGDHIITNPDGTTSDCGAFKCEGSVCKDMCASVKDCVSGYVCNGSSVCVAPSSGSGDSGGCGCRAAGGASERAPLWLTLLGLTAMALRRRRRI